MTNIEKFVLGLDKEQTKECAMLALGNLELDDQLDLILELLDDNDLDELLARLEEED